MRVPRPEPSGAAYLEMAQEVRARSHPWAPPHGGPSSGPAGPASAPGSTQPACGALSQPAAPLRFSQELHGNAVQPVALERHLHSARRVLIPTKPLEMI